MRRSVRAQVEHGLHFHTCSATICEISGTDRQPQLDLIWLFTTGSFLDTFLRVPLVLLS